MSHYLPECVMAFFEKAPEIKHLATKSRFRKYQPYDATAPLLQHLPVMSTDIPPSSIELAQQAKIEKEEQHATDIALEREAYIRDEEPLDPDSNLTTDPTLTLFIGRLDYRVTKEMLMEEFKRYGDIISCRIVNNPLASENEIKSRGYGFIQFQTIEQCNEAYKHADGAKILDKHIVVEFEQRRTNQSWFPRRLGGGRGTTRHEDQKQIVKAHGRYNDFVERETQRKLREEHERRDREARNAYDQRGRDDRHHRGRGGGGYQHHGGNRDRDRHYQGGGHGGNNSFRPNNNRPRY